MADIGVYWWVLAILIALGVLQYAALHIQRRDFAFEKAAIAVQALATTVAIMFAGYWYVYERKGQPQANIGLEVVGLHVAPDHVLLEARFTISNLGTTLLRVGGTDARLMVANADSLPLALMDKLERTAFPERIGGKDIYDDGTLMWPMVRWFRSSRERYVEPGETDLRIVDFVTPCRSSAARIYFAMKRPGSEQMWSDVATVSLAGICGSPVGAREILSERKQEGK